MDITYIHGLEIQTTIGIFDWERKKKQSLIIDIDMGTDFSQAIISDHINDCIDYTKIFDQINHLASHHDCELVESFAEKISQLVLQNSNIQWVKIKINKPLAIKSAQSTGVIIKRLQIS